MGHDHEGFTNDLVRLLPRLRRRGYYLTGCRDAGEDLVQSACERALSRRHQWLVGSRLDRWVIAIMHSIWKNQLRAQRVRLGNGIVDPDTHLSHDGAGTMELRLRTREIAEAARRLPAEQRAVLLLVTVEGYSYREAAALLEIPPGTVMSRLARARRQLLSG